MVFSTEIFLFAFLPALLFVYGICHKNTKICNYILLTASIIFYSWGGVQYCILIIFSTLINYALGLLIESREKNRHLYLILAIIYNLSILCIFKYANFLCDSINEVFRLLQININIQIPKIGLPIGISFFTFQILSYIIDLYYRRISVQKNVFYLGLYIMLFPQLIAGPIVRYIDIEKEIEKRTFLIEDIYRGTRRFCIGFSKKILLANQVALIADTAFNYPWPLHPLYAWIGIISYMLQIYLDFSAYSDMAIGLGNIFGFHFNENFNNPYISTSIKEFWRRWHISLSSWFRDYVYIPLGGNRKGNAKTYLNLLIVFFLTGLWHGASWNFIIWGLYHGAFLLLERKTSFTSKLPKVFSQIYTLIVILIGWIFFRADNLSAAVQYIGYLLGKHSGSLNNIDMIRRINLQYMVFLALSIIASTSIPKKIGTLIRLDRIKDACVLCVFFIAICYMAASDYNPFIYFRF